MLVSTFKCPGNNKSLQNSTNTEGPSLQLAVLNTWMHFFIRVPSEICERVFCDREMEKSVTEKEGLPIGAKEISQ